MRSSHRQSLHTPQRTDTRLVHVKALLPRPRLNRFQQVEGLDTKAQGHDSQEIFPDQRSGQAKTMRAEIQRVSRRPYNILITGETGTGKTHAAREIHRHSVRCNAPFMELNCANLPEQLVEAELFGYRKGAFTGAVRDHIGLFEEANGGILFSMRLATLPQRSRTDY